MNFNSVQRLFLVLSVIAYALITAMNAAAINLQPHLETRHGVRQMVVDGNPFLILGGELNNSSSSSREYMKPIWPELARKNLNTVLAAVTWELTEPTEGKFDFSVVDGLIQDARAHNMHLVLLWFGSWKNGESSYVPYWVKTNPKRFPLIKNGSGQTLNVLSTFGTATRDADARAFGALMRHIREVDGQQHTVLMMQVENEVGVLGDTRDRSAVANKAFSGPVPPKLMKYLVKHKDTLAPELLAVWKANGFKTSGTWTEVFGEGKPDSIVLSYNLTDEQRKTEWRKLHWPVDEIFMAWHYARYVEKVIEAGKREYNIPMYVNAWLQQPSLPWPGTYPSGGPVPQVADIWRAGAPSMDFMSPDLYISEFDETCTRFTRNGNTLFIPEANTGPGSAINALTAILNHNAIGFSPFGIDGWFGFRSGNVSAPDPLAQTYAVLDYLAPLILDNQGRGSIAWLPPTPNTGSAAQEVSLGNYTIHISPANNGFRRFLGNRASTALHPTDSEGFPGYLIICTGPDEYVVAGGNMNLSFTANAAGAKTVRLGSIDESLLVDGHWVPGRRLNGDQTGNDSHMPFMWNFGIYRIHLYQRD